MEDAIDARGLACPAPVLMTREAVQKESPERVAVLVDNIAAKENVSRFLESRRFSVAFVQEGDTFRVSGVRPGESAVPAPEAKVPVGKLKPLEQKIMVLIATDRMGFGDEELGKKLMISFVKTLKEMGKELWRLVLVNNGVKLSIEGSPVLEDLQAYEKDGLTILVCGTCLTYFDLLEAKKVGVTTNMLDIVTAMQLADKVINI